MATEKRAPVQGFSAGIPWAMHLRAYDAYCKKWGKQEALIDLEGRNCRGGFSVGELDDFIPGWRDELSELTAARATIVRLSAELEAARADNERLIVDIEKNSDPAAHCEGCGAPLFVDEDWVSSDDCSGCWYALSDAKHKRERPCFAYRVGKPDARAALAKLSAKGA